MSVLLIVVCCVREMETEHGIRAQGSILMMIPIGKATPTNTTLLTATNIKNKRSNTCSFCRAIMVIKGEDVDEEDEEGGLYVY